MKLSYVTAAVCAPTAAYGLVGERWRFDKVPSGGLKDITFPFSVANAPHVRGLYFSQQFYYINHNGGYIGLQPRADVNGHTVLHGTFSTFGMDCTPNHPNCHSGADGGQGVSCKVDLSGADYSHAFDMVVENVNGTTWRGTMVDTVTGTKTVIGEYIAPQGTTGLKGSRSGFIEYPAWNGHPEHNCTFPKAEMTFYNPTSNTTGAGTGIVDKPYEYGDCIGKVNFSTTMVQDGWTVDVGF